MDFKVESMVDWYNRKMLFAFKILSKFDPQTIFSESTPGYQDDF